MLIDATILEELYNNIEQTKKEQAKRIGIR